MNRYKKLWIVPLLFVMSGYVVFANEQAPDLSSIVEVQTRTITDTPKDFKIPNQLWDIILDKDIKKDEALIIWLPVSVLLTAKTSGILIHDSIKYEFPRGGGTVDLAKDTNGDRGTFYLNFVLNEFTNLAATKVYFISNAKKRRLDGDVYGAGCNVFHNITGSFFKAQSGNGLKFNITDHRHVSALSGHFIFVQSDKDKVFISHVEFTDTKNRDYLCKI